jgi:hypothetical protein
VSVFDIKESATLEMKVTKHIFEYWFIAGAI